MAFRFQHHYTLEEARALLPKIRTWLTQLKRFHLEALQLEELIAPRLQGGEDCGGREVHRMIKALAGLRQVIRQFQEREIYIKDLQRGLVDFPAIVGGKEVFLCWEQDEEDIEYWHDLDSGYAGREPL